jgi:hypothetical protein
MAMTAVLMIGPLTASRQYGADLDERIYLCDVPGYGARIIIFQEEATLVTLSGRIHGVFPARPATLRFGT